MGKDVIAESKIAETTGVTLWAALRQIKERKHHLRKMEVDSEKKCTAFEYLKKDPVRFAKSGYGVTCINQNMQVQV